MSENADRVKRGCGRNASRGFGSGEGKLAVCRGPRGRIGAKRRAGAAFEEEFDIDMDEEAALQVKSVGDAVGFIEKYLD